MSTEPNRSFWQRLFGGSPAQALPGVLSASEFERLFLREKALADRNLRSFALVVLDPDSPTPEALQAIGECLNERLRSGDAIGRLDETRLATLLAATDSKGAWRFADDVMNALAKAGHSADCRVYADLPFHGEESERGNDDDEPGSGSAIGDAPEAQEPVAEDPTAEAIEDIARAVRSSGLNADASGERLLDQVRSSGNARPVRSVEELIVQPLPFWKRSMDILVAGSALLFLSPVLAVLALLVRISSPGPILFNQQRAGLGGRPFPFYKFRSMYIDAEERKRELMEQNEADGPVFKMKNDPRVTPIGRILRRYSLDELPQLWNVLVGDMTLVGPRPPTMDEVPEYESWQRKRLHLTGGLTCTWQVSGRSDIPFEEWMRMDARYARQRSLKTDVSLLARTAKALFTGRGAY